MKEVQCLGITKTITLAKFWWFENRAVHFNPQQRMGKANSDKVK